VAELQINERKYNDPRALIVINDWPNSES